MENQGALENQDAREPQTDSDLTVAAVARRLGVAPATLRTWDRRYGLGPRKHSAGAHRRYSHIDLARLTLMRKLIVAGVTPALAAQKALAEKPENIEKNLNTLLSKSFKKEPLARRDLVATLFRSAQSYDRELLEMALLKDISSHGVLSSWSEVIAPLLSRVGDIWASTGEGIEIEHLVSEIVQGTLRQVSRSVDKPVNARPVVLAALDQEQHTLPLHALAAVLSERKIATQFLGSCTPGAALVTMIKKSAPPAVFLWAQIEKNSDMKFLNVLPDVRPAPRIVLGGPGWNIEKFQIALKKNGNNSRIKISFVEDLPGACDHITRAVGA